MRRVAVVVCLGATLLASSPRSEPPVHPADDPLWIAVVAGSGDLFPIARLAEGSWEVPDWLDPFELQGVEDSEEVELTTDGDGNWSWSGGLVAAGVPTDWLIYSEQHTGSPLTITGGRLTTAGCIFKWALTIDGSGLDLPGQYQLAGVALTRAPAAVLAEDDISGLNRISEELGLIDRSNPWSEGYRKFRWLGFFRVNGTVIGVVHGEYYEGEVIRVVGIDGETGRILARTHMGGC